MLALAALLLTLWIHTGQTLRNCPEDRLYVHTIVPCLDAPKGGSNSNPCPPVQSLFECDHLVYGAVELAVSHLNSRSSTPLPATNTTIQLMAFGQDVSKIIFTGNVFVASTKQRRQLPSQRCCSGSEIISHHKPRH